MSNRVNPKGYCYVNLLMKDPVSNTTALRTVAAHHAIGWAWLPAPTNPERTCINHIDGVQGHNWPSNLEWVSYYENQVHRKLFNRTNQKGSLIIYRDDVATHLAKHVYEGSEITGLSTLQIWQCVKDGIVIDGWSFKHRPRNTAIPKELFKKNTVGLATPAKNLPVQLRDIDTGEITVYPSLAEVAKKFDTSISNVGAAMTVGLKPRFFRKQYQVAYVGQPFQVVNESDIQKAKGMGPKQVLAYNCQTHSYELFVSATDFIKKNPHISKKAIHMALLEHRLKRLGEWYALYRTDENVQRLKTHVKELSMR